VAPCDPQVAGVPAEAREGQETAPVQRRGAIMQVQVIANLAEVTGELKVE
jgi:hypothetical protein